MPEARLTAAPVSFGRWNDQGASTQPAAPPGDAGDRAMRSARTRTPGTAAGAHRPAGRRQDAAGQGRRRGAGGDQRGQQPHLRAHERARRPAAALPHRRLPPRRPGGGPGGRASSTSGRRPGWRSSSGPIGWRAGCRRSGWSSTSRPSRCNDRSRTLRWRAHRRGAPALAADALGQPVIIAIEAASTDPSLALADPDGDAARQVDGWSARPAPGERAAATPARRCWRGRQRHRCEIDRAGRRHRPGLVHRPAGVDEPGQGDGARPGSPDRRRSQPGGLARGRAGGRRGGRPRRRAGRLPAAREARRRRRSSTATELAAVDGSPVVAPAELAAAFGLADAVQPPRAAGAVARLAAQPVCATIRPATTCRSSSLLPPGAARRARGRGGR